MKTKPIFQSLITTTFLSISLLFSYNSIAQKDAIDLTFTAFEYSNHIQLDSIKVMNRTQGGDTILYWPDTVLSLYYVGIDEQNKLISAFQILQNYPNPVTDQTTISFYVPERDQITIVVADHAGRLIVNYEKILDKGTHSVKFTPGGSNLYLLAIK